MTHGYEQGNVKRTNNGHILVPISFIVTTATEWGKQRPSKVEEALRNYFKN